MTTSAIAALAREYWEERLAADPIEATLLGDRRRDAEMPDLSPASDARQILRLRGLLARVNATAVQGLPSNDRITRASLAREIETDLTHRECGLSDWTVDAREGPQVLFQNLASLQTFKTQGEGMALLARWRKIGADIDQRTANLGRALANGNVAPAGNVRRVVRQMDELLALSAADWPLMLPAKHALDDWETAAATSFRDGLADVVQNEIRPAFVRYRNFLRDGVLPVARDDAHAGLLHTRGGLENYARLAVAHTTLTLLPTELHRIGLDELARVRSEMQELGARFFGTPDLAKIQQRMRSDASLYFTTREEVEDKARSALARAEAVLPAWIGCLPRTPCRVLRIEPFEEKDTTIAYYRQPAMDGSRPGTYFINTYAPQTRPRFEAEVLAFHESVPGHHTQIALGQERSFLPEFRKHAGVTAYVEGWALYSERLADEMGLYSSDLDRMGMLSFDAWRCSRLVVDTGIHAMGWSRARAVQYMLDNTVLAENNIHNEVDRYISWPGQALAYKIGQLEIARLRRETEVRLGRRFDIRSFHDLVLGHGALPLMTLRAEVEAWPGAAA